MFFTQINQMMNQSVDITLVIRKKDGTLTVSAMPKANGLKDEAQNHIVPFVVTGTPEELDMGFIQAICQPIQKVSGLLTNMNSFEQQAEKAEANSKAAKELKDKEAKAAKEKKEKFDKHMKNAEDFESQKKYSEALLNLQQAKTFATQQALKQVEDKIKAINAKMGQKNIFDTEDAVTQNQPVQQQTQGNTGQVATNEQAMQHPVNGNSSQQIVQPINGIMQQQAMQQSVNGNTQQTVQQPLSGNVHGQQQTIQQPLTGNVPHQALQQPVNGNIPQQAIQKPVSGNNPQQIMQQPLSTNGQSLFQNVSQQPQSYNSSTYNGCAEIEEVPENGCHLFTADTSIHREDEYAKYPDYPGYSDNRMSNYQIF